MIKEKTILITGGAGYIGSSLAHYFFSLNYKIIVIDNLTTGNIINLHKKWKFYKGDLLNVKILEKIFQENKINIIFHCAAKTNVKESEIKKKTYFRNNILATKNIFNIFLENKNCKKFFFSSSAAVYGSPNKLPIRISSKTSPLNYYGKTKLISEKFLKKKIKKYKNKKVFIMRYFNVIGNFKQESGIVNLESPNLITKIIMNYLNKKPEVIIYGKNLKTVDGTPERDYVDINIILYFYKKILSCKNRVKFKIYNLGSGKSHSVKTIVDIIENYLKVSFVRKYKQSNNKIECDKIYCFNKFSKTINFSTSVINTIKWLLKIQILIKNVYKN